jgi:hypothetical protein
VHLGDLICVDWNSGQEQLTFVREDHNISMAVHRPDLPIVASSTRESHNKFLKVSA